MMKIRALLKNKLVWILALGVTGAMAATAIATAAPAIPLGTTPPDGHFEGTCDTCHEIISPDPAPGTLPADDEDEVDVEDIDEADEVDVEDVDEADDAEDIEEADDDAEDVDEADDAEDIEEADDDSEDVDEADEADDDAEDVDEADDDASVPVAPSRD